MPEDTENVSNDGTPLEFDSPATVGEPETDPHHSAERPWWRSRSAAIALCTAVAMGAGAGGFALGSGQSSEKVARLESENVSLNQGLDAARTTVLFCQATADLATKTMRAQNEWTNFLIESFDDVKYRWLFSRPFDSSLSTRINTQSKRLGNEALTQLRAFKNLSQECAPNG